MRAIKVIVFIVFTLFWIKTFAYAFDMMSYVVGTAVGSSNCDEDDGCSCSEYYQLQKRYAWYRNNYELCQAQLTSKGA